MHIGQFVLCSRSTFPGVVVSVMDDSSYLVSIREFHGDYVISGTVRPIDLDVWEKLSCIGGFGGWWPIQHSSIFQSLVVEALA